MPTAFRVPIQEDIRDLLGDLIGRGVAVERASPLADPPLVAVYVTKDDKVGALCVCDIPFAILAGAALVMVPAAGAKDRAAEGDLGDTDLELAHEVMNVLARVMNTPSTPHLRLAGFHHRHDLPDEAAPLLAAPAVRKDFVATIEGYGEGRLGLLYAASPA